MSAITWQLDRVDPASQRGERFALDPARERLSIGRSRDCDIVLLTATASRRHASLRRRPDGAWWLEPAPGKPVLADGEAVTSGVELCEGLTLEFGNDRLRCHAGHDAATLEPAASPPRRTGRARRLAWGIAAIGLLLVAVLALLSPR